MLRGVLRLVASDVILTAFARPPLDPIASVGYIFMMDTEEFERLVHDALTDVPEWLMEKLENIDIVIEDEPTRDELRELHVGRRSTLLGLYQGVPLTKRGFWYGNVLPDRITLYMGPILRQGGGPEDIAGRVREVVVHEIAHYFGFSDAELKRLERGDG